jgi:hypothetical protein
MLKISSRLRMKLNLVGKPVQIAFHSLIQRSRINTIQASEINIEDHSLITNVQNSHLGNKVDCRLGIHAIIWIRPLQSWILVLFP